MPMGYSYDITKKKFGGGGGGGGGGGIVSKMNYLIAPNVWSRTIIIRPKTW